MTHLNLSAMNFSWLAILPMIAVAIGAMVVLLVGVHVDDDDSAGLGILALATIAAAFILTLFTLGHHSATFNGAIALDNYSAYFEIVILIAAALTVASSIEYAADTRMAGAEYYSLILFATLGMMLLAAGDDLIIIFLGFEMMSIAVYVLVGFLRRDARSSEAALKYFLLGAFSTCFLLYGIALIYGATGTIKLAPIQAALTGAMPANPLLLLGMGMLVIGFGFKIAAVPFHMWTPDAYEGAPTPITGFMAVGVKVAAFAGFLRIFLVHLGPVSAHWTMVLWVLAAITMTFGNIVAIVQDNIKRMLAYSAIAHAGYIIVGMAASSRVEAGGAILYYLLAYAFTNLGAFGVIVALERHGEEHDKISDFRGLARSHPWLAGAMVLFMLSLTGVPPLAGFFGKFYIFSAALHAGLVALVIIAAVNSVVSAYYYIAVIVAMYMQEGGVQILRMEARPALLISIAVAAIGTIVIGIFPQPYIGSAINAFASAFGRPMLHTAALLH